MSSWTGSPAETSLIINGPGKTGYYARDNENSPMDVKYDVTDTDYATGALWRVSWASFSAPSGLSGTLKVFFP